MAVGLESPVRMTGEDLLAMPDDGIERWIVRGELREKPDRTRKEPTRFRNRFHTKTAARLAQFLANWLDALPEPRGEVHVGEAGCRLHGDPETMVGMDVAYISAEMAAGQSDDTTLLNGVPLLVAEVLSPSDTVEDIHEKVDLYQEAGVAIVWMVDPHNQTVLEYRLDHLPVLFNRNQSLSGDPHLPGLRIEVARLF